MEKRQLRIGFIPLTDCAPLVVAQERGFFAHEGLEVELCRETSWANIRDKIALGFFDAAQMLAPMPLAMSLGLGPVNKAMTVALSLGLNGNAITVSQPLFERMCAADPAAMAVQPRTATALRAVIESDRVAGKPPLTLATVFPVSAHNYQLRHWLAAAGIDPDRDVRLVVVPPPQMVERLREGEIDGYCVGEPWNSVAVEQGLGHTVITGYEIWNNGPEKVLGVSHDWAERHADTHQALIRALLSAARWLDQSNNRIEAARLISHPSYVDAPLAAIAPSLTGKMVQGAGEEPQSLPDFHVFHRYAANFPWRSHALWLTTQMVRWGQLELTDAVRDVVDQVYRPDIYRQAAQALNIATPSEDARIEGEHDVHWQVASDTSPIEMGPNHFLDGSRFDPQSPTNYLTSQVIGAKPVKNTCANPDTPLRSLS